MIQSSSPREVPGTTRGGTGCGHVSRVTGLSSWLLDMCFDEGGGEKHSQSKEELATNLMSMDRSDLKRSSPSKWLTFHKEGSNNY